MGNVGASAMSNHIRAWKKEVSVAKAPAKRHLDALGRFLTGPGDSSLFFDHALRLLVEQVGVDHAVLVRSVDRGFQPVWWASNHGSAFSEGSFCDEETLCHDVVAHPSRILIIRDTQLSPHYRNHPDVARLGFRAFLGITLRGTAQTKGVLALLDKRPRDFRKGEISLVSVMGGLLGRALEVEQLRYDLQVTKDALDLATAIVEDSCVESPVSGLPNALYLDIWLKANLYMARRRGDHITLVSFHCDTHRRLAGLQEVAHGLRGEDLLVDLGRGRFLMVLPRTDPEGAARPLEKLRAALGDIPVGGSLWDPLHDGDALDLNLAQVRARAEMALAEAQRAGSGTCWVPATPA